ncbi:MAG: putative metal-binding motif-containing protein [Deltaproteobacteria bacterium]|nr:putative metal-binding motif-containing protein [Deltaproteobacteria bacterium]
MFWLIMSACVFNEELYLDRAEALQDQDGDGVLAGEDCDDHAPSVSPDADEVCDGVDNDCDGEVDEDAVDRLLALPDADGDGYGVEAQGVLTCALAVGQTLLGGDCSDDDPDIHPGAWELCDGVDNDCDGHLDPDDAVDAGRWYADTDGDGFGAPGQGVTACQSPARSVGNDLDCDDLAAAVSPSAEAVCDGVDNDCDGAVDPPSATGASERFLDGDEDGFGAGPWRLSCDPLPGYVDLDGDCDDRQALVYPGAAEACDGMDNDCDGGIDEGLLLPFFADGDGDGWGAGDAVLACEAPPGAAVSEGDCDDEDPAVSPRGAEVCDGVDNDCDGGIDEGLLQTWYADLDSDGWGDTAVQACLLPPGASAQGGDCDDLDPDVYPGSTVGEVPLDGVDQDCDGADWCRDFDCDGVADWVLINPGDLAAGAWTWSAASDLWSGAEEPLSEGGDGSVALFGAGPAAFGDLNGDGYLDLVLTTGRWESGSTFGSARVFFGDGGGGIVGASLDLSLMSPAALRIADLNRDGAPDLIAAQRRVFPVGSAKTVVYLGPFTAAGAAEVRTLDSVGAGALEVADLDGDGWEDVVACGQVAPVGTPVQTLVHWNPGNPANPRASDALRVDHCADVDSADLDGDGVRELLVASSKWVLSGFPQTPSDSDTVARTDSAIYWHAVGADGEVYYTDASRSVYPRRGVQDVDVADLNRDGRPDVVFGVLDGASEVLYGCDPRVCEDGLGAPVSLAGVERVMDLALGDVNGDAFPDAVFCSAAGGRSVAILGGRDGLDDGQRLSIDAGSCARVAALPPDGGGATSWLISVSEDGATAGSQRLRYSPAAGALTSDRLSVRGHEAIAITSVTSDR